MRVLLTGARRDGIGGAIARRLAADWKDRLRIVLSATGRNPGLEQRAADLEETGAVARSRPGDLTDPGFPASLAVSAAETCGGLDAVIACAGQSQHATLAEASVKDWDFMVALHARAPWQLAQAAYPFLKESRGSFTAIGSVSGTMPHINRGIYPVSKAALIMMCRTLAVEWGPDEVRVNVVSPGIIKTPANEKGYAQRIVPLGRAGTAEDVAAAVAFLTGPDAAYITGVNMLVDGGFLQAGMELIPWSPLGVITS